MGSFFSPPKPSAPAPVVYIPAPAPPTPVPVITPLPPVAPAPIAPITGDATAPDPVDDQEKSDIRARNLLRQNRGRLGTIVTSAKGVLTDPANLTGRKNLLGE